MKPEILEHIPNRRSERWKYTNLPARLRKLELSAASLGWGGTSEPISPEAPGAAEYGDMGLWGLNAANTQDVLLITGDETLEIAAKDGQWLSPQLKIHIKKDAQFTVIEKQNGNGRYWKNCVSEIVLEEGAILRHVRFQNESTGGVYTQNTHIRCEKDARYAGFTLTSGAGFSRNQIHAELLGPGAECTLNGINLLSGDQHADTTITVEHKAPHCNSNQFYRSVLADEAHGVFQGKVHVHQVAQKTDGYQLANTLLLSPLAHMDTKPELEIYADDVKCSHGATCGALDEEPLFYMQARGIPKDMARKLLIEAFLGEVVDKVADETVRSEAQQHVQEWLNAQSEA
jgi:Fe-S cluster assembly protein SufD